MVNEQLRGERAWGYANVNAHLLFGTSQSTRVAHARGNGDAAAFARFDTMDNNFVTDGLATVVAADVDLRRSGLREGHLITTHVLAARHVKVRTNVEKHPAV